MAEKIEKIFEYRGYKCVVLGVDLGYRYGYVNIPNPNLLLSDPVGFDIDIHGGITQNFTNDEYPIPSDNPYWIGFDCGHHNDGRDLKLISELSEDYKSLKSNIKTAHIMRDTEVKDKEIVAKEIKRLIDQIQKMREIKSSNGFSLEDVEKYANENNDFVAYNPKLQQWEIGYRGSTAYWDFR